MKSLPSGEQTVIEDEYNYLKKICSKIRVSAC